MSLPWHRANPSFFEKEKAEVEADYPNLHFYLVNDVVSVRDFERQTSWLPKRARSYGTNK